EDHGAADASDLSLAVPSDHRPREALCAGVAAGAGGRAPLPADVADDPPHLGPTEGGAVPDAREDHCAKYPGDLTAGQNPPKSPYSLAKEDSGSVRLGKHYPSAIDTCFPDPLCILLIYLNLLICVSSYRKLRLYERRTLIPADRRLRALAR